MNQGFERWGEPARHRLSVGDYYKIAEVGILRNGGRVELIDREIIDMNPLGSSHAAITNRLVRFFYEVVRKETALVCVQSPLRLDEFNEPDPLSDACGRG